MPSRECRQTARFKLGETMSALEETRTVEAVVESRELSKNYGSLRALDEVSFEVRRGEIFGLIGADGAGKTTAFRIMGGVLSPGGGEIRLLGSTAPEARPRGRSRT